MNLSRTLFVLITSTLVLFTACKEDRMELAIPDNYDGSSYAVHAVAELEIRNSLSELAAEMKKGRTAGTTVNADILQQLFEAGDPSLSSITTAYYEDRINGTDGWLAELSKASGNTFDPANPQGEGGVYVSNLFDEHGLELEQLVEKGLFAAAMYQYAVTLTESQMNEATTDRLLAIFGAHPDFANSDNGSVANPDQYSAKYTARRDKNDGNGLYSQMQAAFIQLQAAIAAGDDYRQEQEEAVAIVKGNWEKAIFATVINYTADAISKLSKTNPTDEDKASALHAYSEAVGFVHGWRTIPQEHKIITDAEIDALLVQLNAPHEGAATAYTYITDPVNELPKLAEVIDAIQAIYSFTDQEVADFAENWVAIQGR